MTTSDPFRQLRAAAAIGGGASSDFDLNPEITLPPGRKLREAAVLVPLFWRDGVARIILTKRSSVLKHHPGQIAFPGGKQDPTDASIEDTALREAHEEIGLPPQNVDIFCTMPSHETVTGFRVTPVLACIRADFVTKPEPGEVAEVFSVPLAHLTDTARYQVQSRLWQGRQRKYYVIPYGPYYIWGATARILRGFAERVGAWND